MVLDEDDEGSGEMRRAVPGVKLSDVPENSGFSCILKEGTGVVCL